MEKRWGSSWLKKLSPVGSLGDSRCSNLGDSGNNGSAGSRINRLLWILGSLIMLAALCGCTPEELAQLKGRGGTGVPDKTGSWAQINQEITRPDNWKQIVKNSQFQLGERRVAGTWKIQEGEEKYYEIEMGTYPLIDGSTVAVPMAVEFARQHLGLSDQDAASFVGFNTTDMAYENLIFRTKTSSGGIFSTNTFLEEKPVDLIIVTEPSDAELALAEKQGVQMVVTPVCCDAFVFIVHKDNPVDSLTVEQIRKIYSGEITNWKEVGGSEMEISPYQREENSGSQTTMEKQVMQERKMLEPNKVNVVVGMGELIETVGEYENSLSSIGYTFKYYIDTLYKSENIKTVKIEGIEPTDTNIQTKKYPFSTNYFGVIRAEDKEKVGGKFLDWMLSEEGQRCIQQAGYCPLK